jgi:type I restriction enzyme R subunit
MNLDNFIIRPNREVVERYQGKKIWHELNNEHLAELEKQVAKLPTEAAPIDVLEKDEELAQRFDHMLLSMQLALVDKTGISDFYQDKLNAIAAKLESKSSVPAVAAHLEWIQFIQTANFWQDLTLEELEDTRKKLRLLMRFIEKESRGVVYTNFQDELLGVTENEGTYTFPTSNDLAIYHKKVKAYILDNLGDLTIQRIKRNKPVTKQDLDELDSKLFDASGIADKDKYNDTIHPEKSLGVFIRELVGLDRGAAKEAFADYLDETRFNSQQIQFVSTIIDFLTNNGVMSPAQLAQPPFSDIHFEGVFGLFDDSAVMDLRNRIKRVEALAVGE